MYYLFDTEEEDYLFILPVECKLFETASIKNLPQGMLYVLPLLYNGNLFVGYIWTGSCRGSIEKILEKIHQKTNILSNKIFSWKIYTQKDLQLHRTLTPKDNLHQESRLTKLI